MSELGDPSALPNREPARREKRPATLRRRLTFLGVACLLGGGITLGLWLSLSLRRPSPPPREDNVPSDPRLSYTGAFGNIHPDVAYVEDDTRCTPCHEGICASYQRHPMGRSLAPVSAGLEDALLDAAHHNPFDAQGFHFAIERQGGLVRHRVRREDAAGHSLASLSFPVHFILGSGTRGRSYLSDQEGFLFQTPISWFSQKQIWDLSPGFSESMFSGRPVTGACLFCHANNVHFRQGSINRFERPIFSSHAIGCERCHGPAERHLQTLRPLDILNPKCLTEPGLRDAVCEQCHLKGEIRVAVRGRELAEFRPGLAFADFCTVFVSASQAGEEGNAVSHFEQMHASRCFQLSQDEKDRKKLGCVSCHDPHRVVEAVARTTHYRNRCLRCHQEEHPCTLAAADRHRQQPDDSCIACHMPRFQTADIAHTAVTDHRILRRPGRHAPQPVRLSADALVPFHPPARGESGRRRDLGIALVNLGLKTDSDSLGSAAPGAVSLLENAVAEDSEDVPAWQAKGIALLQLGRAAEAQASFQSALQRKPQQELCLAGAAQAAQDLKRWPQSRDYWLRAIAVNPWLPQYRTQLAQVLLQMQAPAEAEEQCRAWKRLQPWSTDAAVMEITCLLQQGKRVAAQAEFARLEALNPPNRDALKTWFQQQLREEGAKPSRPPAEPRR